jgi:hypothetical protein
VTARRQPALDNVLRARMPAARDRGEMWTRLACPALVIGASVAVFAPITQNFLHVDDFCHFFDAVNLNFLQFVVQPWGGHVYLFRNALLWPMFRAFGMHLRPYFAAMLALHGLNVLLLYLLLFRYIRSRVTACIAAATWGVCPLHGETLGWLSVVGQVVLSTVYLALLLSIDKAGEERDIRLGRILGWAVLAFLASTSFGMGLSVALLLPLMVCLLVSSYPKPAALVVWATPLAALSVYFAVRALVPSPVGAYVDNTVSIPAALGAWRFVAEMMVHLVTYGVSALCLGFFGGTVAFPGPGRYLVDGACAALVALSFSRMAPPWRHRMIAVAAVWLLSYGLVAAGRAPFLQIAHFTPLKAARISRYHYFPMLGLVLILAMAGRALTPKGFARRRWSGMPALCMWLVLNALGFSLHAPAIDHHEQERRETAPELERIRIAVAAEPPGASLVIPNRPFAPADRVPCDVSGSAGLYLMAFGEDGRVRFRVPKRTWDAARAGGGRVASLLVPDGE